MKSQAYPKAQSLASADRACNFCPYSPHPTSKGPKTSSQHLHQDEEGRQLYSEEVTQRRTFLVVLMTPTPAASIQALRDQGMLGSQTCGSRRFKSFPTTILER